MQQALRDRTQWPINPRWLLIVVFILAILMLLIICILVLVVRVLALKRSNAEMRES